MTNWAISSVQIDGHGVTFDTVDQITLVLRDGRTVRWGSSADSDLKAEVLAQLIAARSAQAYDVSVPGQPTTSGAP